MKCTFLSCILAMLTVPVFSQTNQNITPVPLKAVMTLQIPSAPDGSYDGSSSSSVVWHPVQKKYYAAMCGNRKFPMGVFDASGKRLSPDTLKAHIDIRGLWYNPATQSVQGNTFKDIGWFAYTFNAKGIPTGVKTMFKGKNQPDDNSVGTFDNKTKKVFFIDKDTVWSYNLSNPKIIKKEVVIIRPSSVQEDQVDQKDQKSQEGMEDRDEQDEALTEPKVPIYNYTTVIYTGIPKAEIGILNVDDAQVELYNIKTGIMTNVLKFPEGVQVSDRFNFTYTNGIYWLFGGKTKTWTGYKLL
jgi:hypothetical protein